MSFSSLPPELVHQVIESTVPHTFHSTTYKERQRILSSLTLVSKLFRSIAQPLLLEIVWVSTVKEIDSLPLETAEEENMLKKGMVRWVVVQLDYPYLIEASSEPIGKSLSKLASVTTLTVCSSLPFTVDFNCFSDLSNLHLSGNALSLTQVSFMPNIRSLTLNGVSDKLFVPLLDPVILPNLVAFAFARIVPLSLVARKAVLRLVPRLQRMGLDITVWEDPELRLLHSKSAQTLVDCHSDEILKALHPKNSIDHLRIVRARITGNPFLEEILSDRLSNFATQLQNLPSLPLQSVYLDVSLSLVSELPQNLHKSMEELTRACSDRNIDIVFERIFHKAEIDPCLSLEFAARQEEQARIRDVSSSDV